MAEKGSEPMHVPTVHLLITLRGPVWRVRILIHGVSRLCWRSYRVAEYPTPEAVARRCAAGLAKCKPENDTDNCKIGNTYDCFRPVHGRAPFRVRWERLVGLSEPLIHANKDRHAPQSTLRLPGSKTLKDHRD
nr:MAG TPA: hypothetical protein [Caudoviricetes sp.]